MKQLILFIMLTIFSISVSAQVLTLDDCQRLARANYPLIERYRLIEQTTAYTIENIQKEWYPQIQATAQTTLQSNVATLPEALTGVISQMGYTPKGLKKAQYRVGVDVNQTIWDGGLTKSQKEISTLQGHLQTAQNDVDLYAVCQCVNDLYFGILLLNEKIQLNEEMQALLASNLEKLSSMLRNGVAMQSDVNTMKAEKLRSEQQHTELLATKRSMCRMLALFVGRDSDFEVSKPDAILFHNENRRPELSVFDNQLNLLSAQERLLTSRLMPRVSLFAQGYYGYTGYDMFRDMFHSTPTLNGLVGLRVSWNIGGLYTKKADRAKLRLQREQTQTARETFLFNNRLQETQQTESVAKYRSLLAEDDEIVSLRSAVRRSAESKLTHGIIDTNNLLQEIMREHQAQIDRQTHEIQMLKEIYDLKYTLNN